MCYGCYKEFGSPTIVNYKTKYAAALIAGVYEFSCVGGNAHVVIDDWNLEDHSILWCLNEGLKENIHNAEPEQLATERACLEVLLALNEAERASAMAIHNGFITCFDDEIFK